MEGNCANREALECRGNVPTWPQTQSTRWGGGGTCKCITYMNRRRTCCSTTIHLKKTICLAPRMLLLALLLCLLCVQSADATANSEFSSCAVGQKLSRFKGCECGQYALIIAEGDVESLRDIGAVLHSRVHGPRRKNQHYVCVQCTKCGDGILVDSPCTQRSDTECSPTACTDPAWIFDFGSKSCKPGSTTLSRRTTVTTTKTASTTLQAPPLITAPGGHFEEADDTSEMEMSVWLRENYQVITVGLIVAVVALLVLIVIMMVMMFQVKKTLKRIAPMGTPYSSQNTSNSSVEVNS